ncbi:MULTISPECIES: ABC transporter ATP-binding protein [Rhizobium/Agrobacterium group]|uniref:ABC transporter ATP-binding protein n=2 Tax=Neorhizobium TaxID=1525371 RepID=A0ABV0LYU4_9HYPH|nr:MULTISPECIES: ABC transporter ATP-binding protein [Rhizobium/Agrobacterium group]KGD87594.1 ferrichrome ABC transporter [Rhizobium sp. YS-1r]MCC2612318.1 ABC transporter ATP-binding protein [Neorhizobium petrolearium]WGI67457.1 ABC transporter ATP-binding protein [Neorhizobium petrolearium]
MVALQLQSVGAYHGRKLFVEGVTTPMMKSGEMIAVIGPNAAGKSTLFKRITGILKGPGSVVIDGARRGNAIGYMPQDTSANAVLTVYESILLARKQGQSWAVSDGDLRFIDEIMKALNITSIAFRDLGALSGGQRQLVSIAQALIREPEIMLMDEPTSALDLHRQVEVLDFMQRQARTKGMIVLIAIHDLNQALRFADKVLVIANGRMRACGKPRDVVTAEMLREVYKIHARIEKCSLDHDHVIVDGTAH